MRVVLALILYLFFCQEAIANSSSTIFVGSREGDPESLVKNISTIHGDYSELEVDLCVSGPDLLTLSRFYASKDSLDIATFGGWRFQPQTFFLIRPNPDRDDFQTIQGTFECLDIFIGTPEGSLLKFTGFQNWKNPEVRSKFVVDLEEDEIGLCNTAKGSPSSWTNIKNHILYYDPQSQSFELHLSTGGKRTYVQGFKPHQFLLSFETLPTGNQISYEYDKEQRVKQIRMTNAQANKTLSWITLDYGSSILATASDGTFAEYHLEKDSSGILLLTEVKNSSHPSCTYHYQVQKAQALLTCKELPNGRYTKIDYERTSPYRVATLSVSLKEGEMDTISFAYGEGVTKVRGLLGQNTLYYYDEENRLTVIEETLNDTPYRIRKKKWGERKNQGNITALSIEDSSENTLYYKTFSYDPEGNILEETEYGNLTGQSPEPITLDRKGVPEKNQECHTKKFSYQKTPNEDIISQINEKGNGILFAYIPGTSILKRKEIHQNKQPKRRIFYDYNEEGALIRTITDNGNTQDRNDVDYVRQKFLKLITPKQKLPNVGAPEIIEERVYDPKSRSEILLKKTVNHFDSRGLMIKQDTYDREEAYSYSTEKNYDDTGRLTCQIDPIGNQTTYTYDANGNLIQEKTLDLTIQYDYDLQNNLIAITRFGEGCPPQKTVFAYDAMGNQILDIDSLGNTIQYHYDPLGRLIEKTTTKIEQSLESTAWTYTYNFFDHPTTITDPLKNITTIEYNTRGKPTHITRSDEGEESFIYSLEGSLYRHITPQGITKIFHYDYLGRTTKLRYYEKGSIKNPFKRDLYFYNAFHLLSESTANGDIKYIYNSRGELIQSILAQNHSNVWWSTGISRIEKGEITDFAYDSLGRLIETKKWKDHTHYTLHTQDYDLLGHIIEDRIEDERGKLLQKGASALDLF